jgi:hypothetical protein
MSWTVAIATFALLQGLGKFLDDYHIASRSKDRLRLILVHGFVFADKVRIPNIPIAAAMSVTFGALCSF